MRTIILGGAGYLGSKVIHSLVKNGDEVLCIKRPTSSLERLHDIFDKVSFCNIDDLKEILQWSKPYECFINLSCQYPRNVSSDAAIFEANYHNPLRVFLDCLNNNIKKYITVGTGLPDGLNAYTISKAKLAETMYWYMQQKKYEDCHISICNIELENFYGEDEPKDRFIPKTMESLKRDEQILLTKGTQIRDFIYIDDAVQSLFKIVHSDIEAGYFNIPLGSGEGVSIRELVQYMKQITQSNSELCFGAVPQRINEPDSVADKSQMAQFGINPKCNWKDGIRKLI